MGHELKWRPGTAGGTGTAVGKCAEAVCRAVELGVYDPLRWAALGTISHGALLPWEGVLAI